MRNFKYLLLLIIFPTLFFYKTFIFGFLPIPADALVGLYHPFRDYFSDKFPQGPPYKNFILTDPVLQQYPWKQLAVQGWKKTFGDVFKGPTLPRQGWTLSYLQENPYNFSGAPLLANIQVGVFYPLNLIFFLGEFSQMWTVYIILQPILASLFMFWWLKNSGIKHIAAIFGGLVWVFSSFNLVWMEWGNVGHAGLYLPLALLAIDRIIRTKDEGRRTKVLRWHLVLQFSLVASLLAGHWQVTLYLLAAVGLYSFLSKKFLLFFAHCFLFVILTSFQWVPVWRFIRESNRQVEQENVLIREGFFIRPKQLAQLIAPDFFGNPATGNYRGEWNYSEQVIYVGIIPLVLAILALLNIFTKQTRKDVVNSTSYSIRSLQRFGLILIVVGLIFAVRNPIAEIPYKLNVPIWSDLQPTRLSYLITFGLSVLAAVGLENLIVSFNRSLKNTAIITGGLGAMFLTLLIASSKFDLVERTVSQRNLIWPVLIWGLLGVAGATAWIFRRLPRSLALLRNDSVILFSVLCLLFTVLDLFRFGWKFTPFSPKEYLYPITPAIKFLQNNMRENDRYMTLDRRILPPNANIIYKLKSIEGYDPIYSMKYARIITEMESGKEVEEPAKFGRIVRPMNYRSMIARELNVKYVLSLNDIKDTQLKEVFREGEVIIFEL